MSKNSNGVYMWYIYVCDISEYKPIWTNIRLDYDKYIIQVCNIFHEDIKDAVSVTLKSQIGWYIHKILD